MRVKITEFSNRDSARKFHNIGEIGIGKIESWGDGWNKCDSFTFDDGDVWPLFEFKYIEVPEPSAMSELAGWLNEHPVKITTATASPDCKITVKNGKKLSWLQKIRGYDDVVRQRNQFRSQANDLYSRCAAAESMRDHYKQVFTEAMNSLAKQADVIKDRTRDVNHYMAIAEEALQDRDFNARTADIWQGRLANQNTLLGKRLSFVVRKYHVEIIIGNPITLCSNYVNPGDYTDNEISRCSSKDVYDWKKGVIQSLENLCDKAGYSKELRRDLRKALAKKYPEVFEATK